MTARADERGAALVLVLLVVAAMAALAAEVIATVHGQASRTENLETSQRAEAAVEAGVALARRYLGGLDPAYTYLEKESWAAPVDGMLIEVEVEDESGKLLANSIVFPNGEINEEAYSSFEAVLRLIGMDTSLAPALADWLDADDLPRAYGAEAAYYGRLPDPYAPRNARLATTGEMALVKGCDAASAGRLGRHLTVYSDGLVNLNTATREVILSLSDEITTDMADSLIERRSIKPFRHSSEIREVSGFETLGFSLQGRVKVKSDTFRIRAKASSGGVLRQAEAVVRTGAADRILYWRAR